MGHLLGDLEGALAHDDLHEAIGGRQRPCEHRVDAGRAPDGGGVVRTHERRQPARGLCDEHGRADPEGDGDVVERQEAGVREPALDLREEGVRQRGHLAQLLQGVPA